jgi:peptidoglycan hydrolase CwlO-like protein
MEAKNEVKAPKKGLMILLPVFIILTVISFVFAFSASTETQKYKKMFEKEMAFRLDMEEKVNQLRNEKLELSGAMDSKDLAVKEKDVKIDELNKVIESKDAEIKELKSKAENATPAVDQPVQTEGQVPVPAQP